MGSPYALDFNPLAQAIQNNQQVGLQRNRLAQDEERLGFERQMQPLRVQSTQQQIDSAKAAEGRATALHPLQMSQTQQAIDFAKAGEARTAAMHGPQMTQAQQQVDAGAREAQKYKAGMLLSFMDRFTDQKNPGYLQDPSAYADAWGKMLATGPFKDVDLLNHKDVGPMLRDPQQGPAMARQILENHVRGFQDPQTRRKTEAEIAKLEAEAAALGKKGVGYDNLNQYANTAEGMRKEFQALPNVKGYEQARGAADRLERLVTASKDGKFGTGAGDIAMVFNYMKTLDPESIVMPGEAASARNAPGVTENFRNYYNYLLSGQFLTPATRNDFLNVVNSELASRKGIAVQEAKRYRGLARGVSVNPEHIVPRMYGGIDLDGDGRPDAAGQPQRFDAPPRSTQPQRPGQSGARPLSPDNHATAIAEANAALQAGVPRAAIIERLRQLGVDFEETSPHRGGIGSR